METAAIIRMIAGKYPDLSNEAAKAIQAINAGSPVVRQRLNFLAQSALADTSVELTPDERAAVASLMDITVDEPRSRVITLRLTNWEYDQLQERAGLVGLKLSEFIRVRLFEEG